MKGIPRNLLKRVRLATFRLANSGKDRFTCPVCRYEGPFEDLNPPTGFRRHAACPNCGALERHRLQHLVMARVLKGMDTARLKMIHFAPEKFFREIFARQFIQYETADLNMEDVDHNVDLRKLPFADATYDVVYASHVLEHIPDDEKAIAEIRRILRPDGIALLPVPLVGTTTVEYPEPNPNECGHVRAPGFDYFDRYDRHFARVEKFSSESLPKVHQLFVYEDRSRWPTAECPLRAPMPGEKHIDVVPVCYA
jgi:SAM-dependent methyltransferase